MTTASKPMPSFLPIKYVERIRKEAEEKVCEVYGITRNILTKRSRYTKASHGRWGVWLILSKNERLSETTIADIYGYDRTTVAHGIKRALALKMDEILGINPVDKSV